MVTNDNIFQRGYVWSTGWSTGNFLSAHRGNSAHVKLDHFFPQGLFWMWCGQSSAKRWSLTDEENLDERESNRNCPVSSVRRHVFPVSLVIQESGRLARLHRPITWMLRK